MKEEHTHTTVFRGFEKSDVPALKALVDNAWRFNRFTDSERLKDKMLSAFLYSTLMEQNYSDIAVVDGTVAGLLFGNISSQKRFPKNIPFFLNMLGRGIQLKFSKDGRRLLTNFTTLIDTYKKLIAHADREFDAELVLFIVHSSARGRGIGKQLMERFFSYCLQYGASRIYLFTDNDCNVGFYQRHDFEHLKSLPIVFSLKNGEMPLHVYLYAIDLPPTHYDPPSGISGDAQ